MTISNELVVEGLRCESMFNPIGIDIAIPRFSWTLSSVRRGVSQTGYQIVVFDGEDVMWDTGKVLTDSSIHCEYAGPKLRSRCRYEWKVRVWDDQGETSPWSEVAFWEIGLLHPEDWVALWIEPEQQPVIEESRMDFYDRAKGLVLTDVGRLHPCPILRKHFKVGPGVKRARIYATAHGIYELELNGVRVGDQELAPEMTAYQAYLQYQTYDVTDVLTKGDHVIAATLADGWYAGRVGLMGDNCQYGNKLALLMQLEIDYADGRRQTVITDRGFKSNTGALVYSDLFIGERYDARLEIAGWSTTAYDDKNWQAVREVEHDRGCLIAAYGEPVRVMQEIEPITVLHTAKGETVVDLGQVIAGRVRMRVRGAAFGTEIKLEHGEVLDENGNFLCNIIGRYKDQTDIYVARGAEEEVYEPRFTFHGFRYVKVTGYPGTLDTADFTGVVLSSDLRPTGEFECSDERINQLQANIQWSQVGNMLSIPTDCPQRERAGWTGDIQVFAPTACFNRDVNSFLTRWLRNAAVEQREDGQVPIVVPYMKGYEEIVALMSTDSSAGWGDACIIVPWVLYERYGDMRVLQENYPMMAGWLNYIERSAYNGLPETDDGSMTPERRERQRYLLNTGFHFGDWLIPSMSVSKDGKGVDMMQSAFATKELVSTCFYAYSTQLMSQIAQLLGWNADAQRYAELNSKVRTAFAEEYLDESGRLKAHFQGIYVLALQMNMIPEDARSLVLNQLVTLIEENGNRLDTGFLSVPFLLDVLCDNGRSDVAYRLLYQTECPSWLYEVEKGATTIWEAWQAIMPDGKVTNVSYNHYAFGCVGDWLYRRVAGLDHALPGYKRIVIKPDLDCGLTYARAQYESVYGTIVTEWRLIGNQVIQMVKVPANTTAIVYLPGASLERLTEGGNPVKDHSGLKSVKVEDAAVVIEIGSGSYAFSFFRNDN
ncbi:alpha-L-rhamnosidase [Cohnella abietis]|nr:alpha-L-rhamnosidase [Cohnella abietis]